MSEENLDVVRGIYEAPARGDVPAMLAPLDDGLEWREAEGFPCGGMYRGPKAVS